MYFDAGHRIIDGRGLEINEADRRSTDQYQPACEAIGGHRTVEHVLGRDVARLVVAAEIDPHTAVPVGRHLEAWDADTQDAAFVGVDNRAALVDPDADQFGR